MVATDPTVYSPPRSFSDRQLNMALNPKRRQELAADGQRLKPAATISADELSDAAIAHVRACFASRELVKRIGRVVLLYRPRDKAAEGRCR